MNIYRSQAQSERSAAQMRMERQPSARAGLLRTAAGLALVLVAGVSSATSTQDDQTREELKKFQGTWVLADGMIDGQKIEREQIQRSEMIWRGNEVTLMTPHQSAGVIRAKVRRISSRQEPKEMEWVRDTPPHKGRVVVAIYEFIQPDQYKICFHPAGKTKPARFESKQGSGHIFHLWKRVKK